MNRLVLLFLFVVQLGVAQSFQPVPNALHVQDLGFQEANVCLLYFQNPSGDSLRLRWRLLGFNAPADWQFDICDYGFCYGNFPNTGLMNYVYDTIQPYIKLIVRPGTSEGDAWLTYRVYDSADNANFVDVYFSLYTRGYTPIMTPKTSGIQVFPNPATDYLTIDNLSQQENTITLFSVVGKKILDLTVPAQTKQLLHVGELPVGLYFIHQKNQVLPLLIQR